MAVEARAEQEEAEAGRCERETHSERKDGQKADLVGRA